MAGMNQFLGKQYNGKDGSLICFEEDGSFVWYQSEQVKDDYYYSGTYEVLFREEALDYIVEQLPQFALNKSEMQMFFERNKGDDFFNINNYCLLMLKNEKMIVDGENRLKDTGSQNTYYMGFHAEGYMDVANMTTGNYSQFFMK